MFSQFKLITAIIALVCLIAACKAVSRSSHIQDILEGPCFWDVLDSVGNHASILYTYRFLPEGVCYKYRYQYQDSERKKSVEPVDRSKGEVNLGWSVLNDSTLSIAQSFFRIIDIDKKFIFLESVETGFFVIEKNCSTHIVD